MGIEPGFACVVTQKGWAIFIIDSFLMKLAAGRRRVPSAWGGDYMTRKERNSRHCKIYDVAKAAGVSTKTVSNVMNNKPGVAQKTRERVLDLVAELGYQPHIGARSLRGQGLSCVGLTLPVSMNLLPFKEKLLFQLFLHMVEYFEKNGAFVCFDINANESAEDYEYARGLWQQLYGACVIGGPLRAGDKTIRRIHKWGAPYVALSRLDGFPELSCASVDLEHGAYLSTKALLEKGHKRIGLLNNFEGFQNGIERRRGYSKALADASVDHDPALIMPSFSASDDHVVSLVQMIQKHDVTALVDTTAHEDPTVLQNAVAQADRSIGENLDVVLWTYRDDIEHEKEAVGYLHVPIGAAFEEGIKQLADWYYEKSEGPVNVIHRPTMIQA